MRVPRLPFAGLTGVMLAVISVFAAAQSIQYKVIPITSPYNPSDVVVGNDINKAGVLRLNDVQNGAVQARLYGKREKARR